MKLSSLGLGLALSGGLLCGCGSLGGDQTAVGPGKPGATVAPSGGGETLGADILRVGDKLTITFTDIPNPPQPMDVRVREDGTLTLPLGVQLTAAGRRAAELEIDIQKAYVPRYYVRMTASVKSEERLIYVGGFVRAPGRYAYTGEMTVLKAIKVAGDFTDYGKKTVVELTRADGTKLIIDCKKAQRNPKKYDLPVYPGDTIHVPQKFW